MSRKKVFGLIVFLLLLGALPVAVYFLGQQQNTRSGASPSTVPEEVKITNISDNSFTVSWINPNPTIGFVGYGGTQDLGSIVYDDRDTQDRRERLTYHVTIKNLTPQTTYFFKIGSGSKLYDNNGRPYLVKTAPTTNDPPPLADPVFGKILKPDGTPAQEAIVYLTVAGGTPLSNYTREDGNWLITLNNARRADLATYITYKGSGDAIDVFVQGAKDGTAKATTDTNNKSPIPTMTLGKTFTFGGIGATPTVTEATPSAKTSPSSFSLQPITTVTEAPLSVDTPQQGQTINQNRPAFTGKGKPGEVITITIESSQPITIQVTVNQDGTWHYTPSQDLASGSHTVTASQNGKTVSKNFSVAGIATTPTGVKPPPPLPEAGDPNVLLIVFFASALMILGGFLSFYFTRSS